MNILFALHQGYATNSGLHVAGLARELIGMGHACTVAVPKRPKEYRDGVVADLRVVGFADLGRMLESQSLFSHHGEIDVFHGWTSRGVIQRCYEDVRHAVRGISVVHLEDNEDELVRTFLGDRVLRQALAGQLRDSFPDSLTHPVDGQVFMEQVQGVTVLVDALKEKVPPGIPTQLIWPAADDGIFYPRSRQENLRQQHGVPADAVIIAYTGNVHPANFREVRSLYLAVHLLNRGGIKARVVRTGKDYYEADRQYEEWSDTYTINFGFVKDRQAMGQFLAMADVLIQPGRTDSFNAYRFPSKLPEFFACGKPVVLPKTNIGLVTRHLQDAYVLAQADGPSIADAVRHIVNDSDLSVTLGKGARLFYEDHFSWKKSSEALVAFYTQLLQQNPKRG